MKPTIFADVSPNMRIVPEEVLDLSQMGTMILDKCPDCGVALGRKHKD